MNVNLFLKADGRAMEQDEIIYLTLTQTEGSKFQGVFVINVTIIDSDGKCYLKCFLNLFFNFTYSCHSFFQFKMIVFIL